MSEKTVTNPDAGGLALLVQVMLNQEIHSYRLIHISFDKRSSLVNISFHFRPLNISELKTKKTMQMENEAK